MVNRVKEEIWLNPTPKEKSKKQRDNTKNANKNFDYTTIADRLRTLGEVWFAMGIIYMSNVLTVHVFTCYKVT